MFSVMEHNPAKQGLTYCAAVLGLSAVLTTSAVAFQAVKIAGVAYLIYLGIRALLEKARPLHLPQAAQVSVHKTFSQGVLTELLTPKTAWFFLAFLPQFVRPGHGAVTLQLLTLGLTFVLMSAVYTALFALTGSRVARLLARNPAAGPLSSKLIGVVYLTLVPGWPLNMSEIEPRLYRQS